MSSGGGVSGWVGVYGGVKGGRTGPVPVHPSLTQTLRWGLPFPMHRLACIWAS